MTATSNPKTAAPNTEAPDTTLGNPDTNTEVPGNNPGTFIKTFIKKYKYPLAVTFLVLFFSIGSAALIFVSTPSTRPDQSGNFSTNRSIIKKQDYCTISDKDICEGKYVEIQGHVTSSKLVPGVGYLFEPEGLTIKNPIYIQGVIYTASRLGGFDVYEEVPHKIPFGQKVVIRGTVVMQDSYRCTQLDYATANPDICKPDGFRLKISPDSFFTIPAGSDSSVMFSIFGKIKDIESAKKTCPNQIEICEGLAAGGPCHKLAPTDLYCGRLSTDPNMFLVTGYYEKDGDKPLSPFDAYHVRGMSFRNQPLAGSGSATGLINTVLTQKRAGTVTVFSKKGEEVTMFDTGITDYYDLELTHPSTDAVHYFIGSKLYKKAYDGSDAQFLGTLDPQVFKSDQFMFNFHRSKDGKVLHFVTSKQISEKIINSYSIRTEMFYVHQLDFDNLNIDAGVIKTDIVYSEEMEGFFRLASYNAAKNTLLVTRTFYLDYLEPCYRAKYYIVDLNTKATTEIATVVEEGGKFCGEQLYRKAFVSDDGGHLVLAGDFNEFLKSPRISKLYIYDINGSVVKKQELLAERELIDNNSIKIRDVDEKYITISYPWSFNVLYNLDRSKDTLSVSNLFPLNYPNESISLKDEFHEYRPIISLPSAEYLHQDADNWYFFSMNDIMEKRLYIVKKETKDMFIAAIFSYQAKAYYVNGELYIVDFQ